MKKLTILFLFALISSSLFAEDGIASWYTADRKGALTANGEVFDTSSLSAAHRSLTFGSIVRVTDRETGASVDVRINDRGPYAEGRIIDLTPEAARQLGIYEKGIAEVTLEVLSEPETPETKYIRGVETGWYTVQIGTYTNMKNAYAVVENIKKAGLKPTVDILDGPMVRISVKYIQSYRLEGVLKTLEEAGITEPLVRGELNPYSI
ncbi:MAG: septal ring lytic transglycosylase RlpA family protein [Bullifex sp.]